MRFNDLFLTELGPLAPEDQIGAPVQPQTPQQQPIAAQPETTPAPMPITEPNESIIPTADIISDLDEIGELADGNPKLEQKVSSAIQAILKYANAATAKFKPEVQPKVKESMVIYSDIAELEDQIENLAPLGEKVADVIAVIRKKIAQLKENVKSEFAKEREAGGEEVKKKLGDIEQAKKDFANKLVQRLGKSPEWGQGLVSALDRYDNPELTMNFLELCANGRALAISLPKEPQVVDYKLTNIVDARIKPILDPANRKFFKALKDLPWTEGSGRGGGVGPGESLLACLIPNATQPPKGDLFINGENWEVKAGSYTYNSETNKKGTSNAWLDCSSNSDKAPVMKQAFMEALGAKLKTKNQRKIKVGNNVLTLGEVIRNADFRKQSLPYLKIVLEQLERFDLQYDAISAAYKAIVPTVAEKRAKTFNNAVTESIDAILNLSADTSRILARIHARLSLLEYGIGDYKSPNFIFYNSTTQDIVFSQGTSSINKSVGGDSRVVPLYTFTMNGTGKASAGVFLAAADEEEVDNILGYQRKRGKKV